MKIPCNVSLRDIYLVQNTVCEIENYRINKVESSSGGIKLRLLIDLYSFEVFVNNDEYVMSSTVYAPQNAQDISFYSDKTAYVSIEKWYVY